MSYTCPSLEPDPPECPCANRGEYDPTCTNESCKERA